MRVLVVLGTIALAACGLSVRGDDETPLGGNDRTSRPDDAGTLDATYAELEDGGRLAQVNLQSHFDVDIVLNRNDGVWDTTQDAMDGSGYVLVTASADRELYGSASPRVLPDDARFEESPDHAAVQLGWRNDDDGPNAKQLRAGAADLVVPVPPLSCRRLVLYGTSVEGPSTVDVTVRYADGTETTVSPTFTDWASRATPAGGFLLAAPLRRASVSVPNNPAADPYETVSIAGVRVAVDQTKPLVQIAIHDRETGFPRLYLLGIGLE